MNTLEVLAGFHDYISQQFAPEDEALSASRERAIDEGIPEVSISPSQGKLMQMLARLVGARRILEVGTLGGTSAIWLARAPCPKAASSSRWNWKNIMPRLRDAASNTQD